MQNPGPDQPSLWIIADANGSGKSSAYRNVTIEAPQGSIWIINPDELTKRIQGTEHLSTEAANREAVIRIEAWLQASILSHQTVGVETVLSTDKYRKLVVRAHELGFRVHLIYVILESVDLNIERVAIRVRKGGHDVPESKIRERRVRSLAQLGWFFEHADAVDIYDNSGAEPVLVAQKRENDVRINGRPTDDLLTALEPVVPDIRRRLGDG